MNRDSPSLEASDEVDGPVAMAQLARTLLRKGETIRALDLCEKARALAPDDGEVFVLTAEVLSRNVPAWHFPVVLDTARHGLYEQVFRRIVRPNDLVLDIGSGTGLFALMLARIGAKVVTCEHNPIVADAVARVITRNGLAHRVKIVAKNSTDLEVGADLERPVDVVVWDNLANNLIGAGVLPAIEHAVRRLARPGAPVIPARGRIRVALAEERDLFRTRMGTVEGFDMSPFDRRSEPRVLMSNKDGQYVFRSEPADLFRFDFESGGPFPGAQTSLTLHSLGGRVGGLAQWMPLELDATTLDDNRPPMAPRRGMVGVFHRLMEPRETRLGEPLTIHAAHDRETLRIWADVPPRDN